MKIETEADSTPISFSQNSIQNPSVPANWKYRSGDVALLCLFQLTVCRSFRCCSGRRYSNKLLAWKNSCNAFALVNWSFAANSAWTQSEQKILFHDIHSTRPGPPPTSHDGLSILLRFKMLALSASCTFTMISDRIIATHSFTFYLSVAICQHLIVIWRMTKDADANRVPFCRARVRHHGAQTHAPKRIGIVNARWLTVCDVRPIVEDD